MKGDRDTRKLGVIGTMVWDTIYARDGRGEPMEEWGGIGYALEALAAALPPAWEVVPFIKVGGDLAERAFHFLHDIPRVLPEDTVRIVPTPHPRVELRYQEEERRCERLTGGVPPWGASELAPAVQGVDALYVNFISGFELELETAQLLREVFQGPTYADLHSLFLGVGVRGLRVPRLVPRWSEWLRCFDAVQMNESEFDLLRDVDRDPWQIAAEALGAELKLVVVTLGVRGAAYIAGPGFREDPGEWASLRRRVVTASPPVSGMVASGTRFEGGDPTGCGDVWGATLFARLLAGDTIDVAMANANRFAARNVLHRGASGLHMHLQGQISSSALPRSPALKGQGEGTE